MSQTPGHEPFAAAVTPPSADTVIHTPLDGLIDGNAEIPVAGETLHAYWSRPQSTDRSISLPVVIVIQEIFGVHAYIRNIVRRLATQGYLAVAPSLFDRQGDPGSISNIGEIVEKIVSRVPDQQVFDDLDATLAWAIDQGGDARRIALTGFCWGGRITWLYAARQPAIKAAVAWYGRLGGAPDALKPQFPIDVVGGLKAPVLGLYGGADAGISVESVERFRQQLLAARSESEIHLYPDAPHAFHADYRPSYRKDAAEDGWQRLLAWLSRFGV